VLTDGWHELHSSRDLRSPSDWHLPPM